MAGSGTDTVDPNEIIYCVNHPTTETRIRCSRCLDPICPRCAVRAPVGLRCPRCAKIGRSPLYVIAPQHYVLTVLVTLATSVVAGTIMAPLGLFFSLFLALPAGGIIAEVVTRTVRKRGRAIQVITAIAIAVGALMGPMLWQMLASGGFATLPRNPLAYLASAPRAIASLVYAILAISAAVARLR